MYFIIDKYAYTGYCYDDKESAEKKIREFEKDPMLLGYNAEDVVSGNVDMDLKIEEHKGPEDDSKTSYHYMFAMNGWADHVCTKCGYKVNDDVHVYLDWKYCPNCGRKIVSGTYPYGLTGESK